nr:DNA-3-methyladenine glycosylase I [Marinilactibacillus kalidii]
MKRCAWVTEEPLYIDYHDLEWGKPLYDDQRLFEMLCLEGAQAGLSWWTILQRREGYRRAFADFDPAKIVQFDEDTVQALMQNEEIIRNQLKIRSVLTNARAYLKILESGQSFSDYIWQFVDHQQVVNHWDKPGEVPATTEISTQMSKQLKKDGFKFVGPTICYAYMQAVGMVNDHLTTCDCYEACIQK